MDILDRVFWNNTIMEYMIAFAIIVIGVVFVFIVKTCLFSRLEKRAAVTSNKFDDLMVSLLGKTLIPALYYGAFFVGLQHLKLSASFDKVTEIVGVIILTFLGIRFIISLITYGVSSYWSEHVDEEHKIRNVKTIMPIVKIVIYAIGVFFLLDNLGFKISTLVAGLGIGGVAVALAGQAVLSDLFSYFAILFDRPFEIGDFIVVDTHMGVVEHVGIKTTRIRSLGGEQIVLSNSDLTNSRVKNYKRMEQRRVVFKIGVTYQTPSDNLKEIPNIIKKIIENIKEAKFDRSHFFAYGDFSLNFETVYYVFSADYNKYMDVQQEINLALYNEFEKRGIEFAYPTQTLFLNKEPVNVLK